MAYIPFKRYGRPGNSLGNSFYHRRVLFETKINAILELKLYQRTALAKINDPGFCELKIKI